MDTEEIDVYLATLAEMYNELRSYRDKEFQTFLFAFPIIGTGFLMKRSCLSSVLCVLIPLWLTLFGGAVGYYIYRNFQRTKRIKKVIVSIQDTLEINNVLKLLNPQSWAEEPLGSRLGTVLYLHLIAAELICLWLYWYAHLF